jgi:hypothetical protein
MLGLVKTSGHDRSARRLASVSRRAAAMATSLRLGVVALLLVFHAVLFWTHLIGGRLFEPAVALRWGIGFVLLGLLVGLRRIGVPLFWGRRALVVWVLVALLHVGAAMPVTAPSLTTDTPTDITLSIFVLPQAAGIAFAAGLLLLALRLARGWRLPVPIVRPVRRARGPRISTPLLSPRLAPRAPPVPVF